MFHRLLIVAVALFALASTSAAQTETPTETPTDTPTATPTDTPTPTNTPTATVASTITPAADAEIDAPGGQRQLFVASLGDSNPVGVVAAPPSTQRIVVHDMTLSSTAAATVALRIGAAIYTFNLAAGVPYSIPAPLYGGLGHTVVLTRTAGSAAVNATLWVAMDFTR